MSPTVLSLWETPLRGILKHRQADQHIRQKIRGGFFRKGCIAEIMRMWEPVIFSTAVFCL